MKLAKVESKVLANSKVIRF